MEHGGALNFFYFLGIYRGETGPKVCFLNKQLPVGAVPLRGIAFFVK